MEILLGEISHQTYQEIVDYIGKSFIESRVYYDGWEFERTPIFDIKKGDCHGNPPVYENIRIEAFPKIPRTYVKKEDDKTSKREKVRKAVHGLIDIILKD